VVEILSRRIAAVALLLISGAACNRTNEPQQSNAATPVQRQSILLVTLDTMRADAIGPEAPGVQTPGFNAVAARGRRYRQAYATVPETLPSHTSMFTGLYPAGHGIHENARYVSPTFPLATERLHAAGYRTSAFVSAFVLARRFGLARGFDVYDDGQPAGGSERPAAQTTDAALAELGSRSAQPRFMWVHYYDAHSPYAAPEPFRTKYAATPYLGEVAYVDSQLGRLVRAFEEQSTREGFSPAFVIVGDHGEGLGDHGESQHGDLLYQSTMRVPLLVAGAGIDPAVSDAAVSTRHVFDVLVKLAGIGAADALVTMENEVVLGEAMKPFLEYGWQPQVMAVRAGKKAILAGTLEAYDLVSDPGESRNLGAGADLAAEVRRPLEDYPVPSPEAATATAPMDDEARRRLASLGYVSATAAPVVRKNAPRPADMTALLDDLEKASGLFSNGQYAAAIPLLEKIRTADPYNLDAVLRLATAHSALGHDAAALAMFRRAAEIAPRSQDVRVYLALHYARGRDWQKATPILEEVVAASPDRLPASEALARIRERQGRTADAIALWQTVYAARDPTADELVKLGTLAMSVTNTDLAIQSFERARQLQGTAFRHDLELGVLYLSAKRLAEARDALDRVSPRDPDYPMALFKRAQVSVLLNERDRAARIAAARQRADATTRELIAREKLFQGVR
jgi:arylsulfatase A-like enzyme/Tfp pilus assembly protein PilF